MNRRVLNRRSLIVLALIWGGLLAWLTLGLAQSVAGNAQAVQATVLGTTTVLASEALLGTRAPGSRSRGFPDIERK